MKDSYNNKNNFNKKFDKSKIEKSKKDFSVSNNNKDRDNFNKTPSQDNNYIENKNFNNHSKIENRALDNDYTGKKDYINQKDYFNKIEEDKRRKENKSQKSIKQSDKTKSRYNEMIRESEKEKEAEQKSYYERQQEEQRKKEYELKLEEERRIENINNTGYKNVSGVFFESIIDNQKDNISSSIRGIEKSFSEDRNEFEPTTGERVVNLKERSERFKKSKDGFKKSKDSSFSETSGKNKKYKSPEYKKEKYKRKQAMKYKNSEDEDIKRQENFRKEQEHQENQRENFSNKEDQINQVNQDYNSTHDYDNNSDYYNKRIKEEKDYYDRDSDGDGVRDGADFHANDSSIQEAYELKYDSNKKSKINFSKDLVYKNKTLDSYKKDKEFSDKLNSENTDLKKSKKKFRLKAPGIDKPLAAMQGTFKTMEELNADRNIGVEAVAKTGYHTTKGLRKAKRSYDTFKKNQKIKKAEKLKDEIERSKKNSKFKFSEPSNKYKTGDPKSTKSKKFSLKKNKTSYKNSQEDKFLKKNEYLRMREKIVDAIDEANVDRNIGVDAVIKPIQKTQKIKRALNKFNQKKKIKEKIKSKKSIKDRIVNFFKKIGETIKAEGTKWLLLAFLILILIGYGLTSCTAITTSLGAYLSSTSYLADFKDVTEADKFYSKMEAELIYELENIETVYPGYDEYRVTKGSVGHDPHLIMAYLTIKYEDFKFSQVQKELKEIFKWQYQYEVTRKTEIRYRTETRNGRTVRVPYRFRILEATLFTNDLEEVLKGKLNEEEKERFDVYMESKGNFMFYESPFGKDDWKPKINKLFGYIYNSETRKVEENNKLDLKGGKTVYAVTNGKITSSGGDSLTIEDEGKWTITYKGLSQVTVNSGEVKSGDEVGTSGENFSIEIKDEEGNILNPYFHLYSESKLQNDNFYNPDYGAFDFGSLWGQGGEMPEEGQVISDLFEATAYTADPAENGGYSTTAMGTPLERGVIAVDPSVIPLGSKLWVEGYGVGRAEDTGGAIKGRRLDLLMDSKAEASQWGRRMVKVAILPDDYTPEPNISLKGQAILTEATKWLGTPYRYGEKNIRSGGIDCSGFVCWSYNNSGWGGRKLSTGSHGLYAMSQKISRQEAQPGDLVFFKYTFKNSTHPWGSITHVGIYMGDGKMIHAGNPVNITSIDSNYWKGKLAGFGRIN